MKRSILVELWFTRLTHAIWQRFMRFPALNARNTFLFVKKTSSTVVNLFQSSYHTAMGSAHALVTYI